MTQTVVGAAMIRRYRVYGHTKQQYNRRLLSRSRCLQTQAGLILAFRRKRFMGSNCFFSAAKRVKFGP